MTWVLVGQGCFDCILNGCDDGLSGFYRIGSTLASFSRQFPSG